MSSVYSIAAKASKNQAIKGAAKRAYANRRSVAPTLVLGFAAASLLWGCALPSKKLVLQGNMKEYSAGAIIKTETAAAVPFGTLIEELKAVRVVYVGETHTNPAHHQIQLKVIQALAAESADLCVGMEMFDRSYQATLDRWSGGLLEKDEFLRRTHWYANWRYPYELYAEILDFIKLKKIRLVALNLPFHIPPKIRIGGLDSLSECEAAYLPERIDLAHAAHRAYVEDVFKQHHGRVKENFEYFYQAQCVWEDVMAEAIAGRIKGGRMVVLAGNGHIIRKFGVPDRAFKRSGVPFRTVFLAPAGSAAATDVADYIWVSP